MDAIIDTQISNRYWSMLKNLNDNVKMDLIARLTSSLGKKEAADAHANWTDRYAGKWQDSRSADEMVEDIRKSRQFGNRKVEL